MGVLQDTPQGVVDLVARGLDATFRPMVEARLREVVDEVVKQVAKAATEQIVRHIETCRRIDRNTLEVRVAFNNKEVT